MDKFFDSRDFFATPVQSFNFEGRKKLHTSIGVFCSQIVTILMLAYASQRCVVLFTKANPNIITFERFDMWASEKYAINITQEKFQIAFAVNDQVSKEQRDDPSKVEWAV
jgi:hypothetical protein